MYAIIDLESTGGKYNEEAIIEIAIYKFDGNGVVDQFVSLVNPEVPIPSFVEKLTKINKTMVRTAPKFYQLAKRIIEITEDCILVAHNISFDYRLLKLEFSRLGYAFSRSTICTIELSKKLIPDLNSYGLDNVTKSLGIPIHNRHRAIGDAQATLKLFKYLLIKDEQKTIIEQYINQNSFVDREGRLDVLVASLPEQTGVLYIYDKTNSLIYIEKASNIKKKASNIFVKSSKIAIELQKQATSITFEITGSMLIASLKEYHDIGKLKPRYSPKLVKMKYVKRFFVENQDVLIIDKGREVQEKSVIMVRNGVYKGFSFFELNYQINNTEILNKMMSFPEIDSQYIYIIEHYLQKKNNLKVVVI
ncbi:MAG: exonuclease domain-containing protein [Bacteroidota bacterium]|nr:exonuclease domain-containing protein [Bacteroidota bacterium]